MRAQQTWEAHGVSGRKKEGRGKEIDAIIMPVLTAHPAPLLTQSKVRRAPVLFSPVKELMVRALKTAAPDMSD
jgi:hypothetical protein